MPKYHTSLTPVTLFLLRTCLYFQILYQHSFISHKCLKLNICKTEFGLLFSNQTLPSVLSQPRESAFISIFFQDGSFDYPLDLAHSLTDLNLITQHNFLKFFQRYLSSLTCLAVCTVMVLFQVCLDHSFKLLQQSIPST